MSKAKLRRRGSNSGSNSSGSSSSGDDASDEEIGSLPDNGDTCKTLTLCDDSNDSGLIAPPPDDEDAAVVNGDGLEAAGEEDDDEVDGEGAGEPSEGRMPRGRTMASGPGGFDDAYGDKGKMKAKKKKKKKVLYICTVQCKYDVVRRMSKKLSFKEVGEDEDWNLYWTDFSVALERVMEMKRYQKINHFPGMTEVCRKDLLARNMNRMLKLFPKEYNVFPKSWVLPADYGEFQSYARSKKNKTYILKPASGCQGRGIWVTKNPKDIKPNEHIVCQQYLSRPFTIDGFKFDLRVYALVTSCDPFRIFVFKDGLARFATVKYHEPTHGNTDNVYMHLTNYAINKNSESFIKDDEEGGSKRRITTINRWWKENGYDVERIWEGVDDIIIKTLISVTEILQHNYRSCFPNHVKGSACFEILGFDIMFDKKLKPYVVEVNHSPSFHTDAQLDKEIKEALIYDTINLVNCGSTDKRKCIEEERRRIKERLFQRGPNKKESKEELEQQQAAYLKTLKNYEDTHMGNFRRIYPCEGYEKYDKYFNSSGSLFQETASYKARSEAARMQREEIRAKQEKLDAILRKKQPLSQQQLLQRDAQLQPGGVRPESPGSGSNSGSLQRSNRQHRLRRQQISSWRLSSHSMQQQAAQAGGVSSAAYEQQNADYLMSWPLGDSGKPCEIVEEEELERVSSLLQRDNLVRGLGIVEHVCRMLQQTTAGSSTAGLGGGGPQHPMALAAVAAANAAASLSAAQLSKSQAVLSRHRKLLLSFHGAADVSRQQSFGTGVAALKYTHGGSRDSAAATLLTSLGNQPQADAQASTLLASYVTRLSASADDHPPASTGGAVASGGQGSGGYSRPLGGTVFRSSNVELSRPLMSEQWQRQLASQLHQLPVPRNGKYPNGRKYGTDAEADRKHLTKSMYSDLNSASGSHYQARTMSGTGYRRHAGGSQIMFDPAQEAAAFTPAASSGSLAFTKVQPPAASAPQQQQLSVVSAPAPVLQRPDATKRLSALDMVIAAGKGRLTSRDLGKVKLRQGDVNGSTGVAAENVLYV